MWITARVAQTTRDRVTTSLTKGGKDRAVTGTTGAIGTTGRMIRVHISDGEARGRGQGTTAEVEEKAMITGTMPTGQL